jgi:hypothetical protein
MKREESLTGADLYHWLALRRVSAGGVTKLGDRWRDHSHRVPDYVTDALTALRQDGLVTLTDPHPGGHGPGGAHRRRNRPFRATAPASPEHIHRPVHGHRPLGGQHHRGPIRTPEAIDIDDSAVAAVRSISQLAPCGHFRLAQWQCSCPESLRPIDQYRWLGIQIS